MSLESDQPRIDELFQVPIEIPVGQIAELFQFAEGESFGCAGQTGHQSESGLFVKHAIETLVGVSAGRTSRRWLFLFRQLQLSVRPVVVR